MSKLAGTVQQTIGEINLSIDKAAIEKMVRNNPKRYIFLDLEGSINNKHAIKIDKSNEEE